MKFNLLIICCTMAALSLQSQTYTGVESVTYNDPRYETVVGTGDISTELREIEADFSEIIVGDCIQLYPNDDPREYVTLKGQQNILDLIETKFENNQLTIKMTKPLKTEMGIKVYVSLQGIAKITLKENAFIDVQKKIKLDELDLVMESESIGNGNFDVEKLNCTITGGAKLNLKGSAEESNVLVEKHSVLNAKAFTSTHAEVEVSNYAICKIKATEKLAATVKQEAELRYFGNPEIIRQKVESNGRIISKHKKS